MTSATLTRDGAGTRTRTRVTRALAIGGWLALVTAVTIRWLRDGSFWLDEASIALNLLTMEPSALFGRLDTAHSFPRLYLLAIAGLQQLFGYHTLVLRALPVLAVAGGAALWLGLLHRRLRERPLLLLLGVALAATTGTWLAYGVMLKQYSLELLLALVPFVLDDGFYERTLRRGVRSWQLLPVVACVLLSYSYVIPLLGRVLGWYAAGWRQHGWRLPARGVALAGAALAGGLALLFVIELRHAAGNPRVQEFWALCVPSGSPLRDAVLFHRSFVDWYSGNLPFSAHSRLPGLVGVLLEVAFVAGIAAAPGGALSARLGIASEDTDWGSRSLGAAIAVAGLVGAAYLVGLPTCAGRLTLFALPLAQLLALDGLAWLGDRLAAHRWGRVAFAALVVGLLVPVARAASLTLYHTAHDLPYQDVRPLLHRIDAEPDLQIVVTPCSDRQLRTLPEWRGRGGVLYLPNNSRWQHARLLGYERFWLIDASRDGCRRFMDRLDRSRWRLEPTGEPGHSARLWQATRIADGRTP